MGCVEVNVDGGVAAFGGAQVSGNSRETISLKACTTEILRQRPSNTGARSSHAGRRSHLALGCCTPCLCGPPSPSSQCSS